MFEKVVCRLTKTPGSLEDVLLRELPYTEDKEVKSSEDFRSRVIGDTTPRMASAELPRQGCHFMNAFNMQPTNPKAHTYITDTGVLSM